MKDQFTVSAGGLASAVRHSARWLAARPTNPVHACLMLSVDDGVLDISGFNETTTARATIDVEGPAGGKVVVAGRLLGELVKTLPDKPVTFREEGAALVMESGRFRATLPTVAEEDYPGLPGEAPLAGHVDGEALETAIRRVGVAAGTDPARAVLMAVHVHYGADALELITTDTYRGVRVMVPWEPAPSGPPPLPSLVLARTLVDAVESFVGPERVRIGVDSGAFSLATPTRSLVSGVIGGKFPAADLRTLFGGGHADQSFSLKVRDLVGPLGPLKRASQLKEKETDAVMMTLTGDEMALSSGAGSRAGDEGVDVTYAGPDTTIIVRAEFFEDALTTAPGDEVTIAFQHGTTKAAVMSSAADESWRHILVPLRRATAAG